MNFNCYVCDRVLVIDDVVINGCRERNGIWYCPEHLPAGESATGTRAWCAGNSITPEASDAEPPGIERPDHYKNSGKFRDYEVADDWGLPAILAQALKYIKRHAHKGKPVEDLEKARDCITLHLEHIAEQLTEETDNA